jgi:hypothetical protein
LKEVKALLKKERAEEGRDPSHLDWKIIFGCMDTRLQRATPVRVAISTRMGLIMR